MKKTFNILLALIIAFFTLPFSGNTVLADEKTYDDIEDGEYEISVEALEESSDKISSANGFLLDKATLSIQDGDATLTVGYDMDFDMDYEIFWTTVEGKDPISEDKSDNAQYYSFELDEVKSIYPAAMEYAVPDLPPMADGHEVQYRLVLDTEVLEELELEEEAEEPEEEENNSGNEDNDNSIIELDSGHYTIDASYLKSDGDDASAMGRYLDPSIFLDVQDEKVNATITINEDETVTKLQLDGKDAVESVVDGEQRYETFELEQLDSILDAYVEYQAPSKGSVYEGQADFRVSFNTDSLIEADATDKPGYDVSEEPEEPAEDPTEDPKEGLEQNPSNDPKEEPKENPSEKPKAEPKAEQKEEDALNPDKAYKIDYTIKHETEDKTSAADSFFEKPGILLEKDGVYYLQVKVTGSSMIDNLKTEYGPVLIVEEAEDTMVVQFKVHDDLSQANVLDMHITVPGMYSEDHSARLFLDESSMEEVNADDYELVAGSEENDNGPLVEGKQPAPTPGGGDNGDNNGNGGDNGDNDGNDDNQKGKDDDTPKKPDFGDNDGNGTGSGNGDGKAQNPQTGDTSGLLLYTLLLIGSLIPLGFKLRHRFI